MPDSSKRSDYEALIKPGDAISTPDGKLWVVEQLREEAGLHVVSAYRGADGETIFADRYDATRTEIPTEYATKVADARQVRR